MVRCIMSIHIMVCTKKGSIKMWLPKDERYLLRGYWHLINEFNVEKDFSEFELVPLLSSPKNWKKIKEDSGDEKKPKKDTFNKRIRVSKANDCLYERKLINLRTNGCYCTLSLTMNGFDLARKYSSWWERYGLWFASLKDHWIWLLCSLIGCILGALIIEVIKKCLN